MKKRQARKTLNQVVQQGRPINLPDGQRASNSEFLAGSTLHELKSMAGLARRFDGARRRQEQSFNRNFRRATRNRRA